MDYFSIIKDADVFENPGTEPEEYRVRPTAKGIVLDSENRIALLSNGDHSLFPGGGVDEGETFEQAFIRECKEEIGCDVKVSYSLGKAMHMRAKNMTKYDVEFFVGRVIGEKGLPTTNDRSELACTIDWLAPDEVLKVLEEQMSTIREDDYPAHFNCPTHLAVFKKYVEKNKS
jgi:8-oxo-dGTP diphosphatase